MNDINDIIRQAVEACNLGLYGVEKSDGGFMIYIENEDNTISIKDCEMVMKQLTYSTDTDHLHLEVSSKGLYPPILTQDHFKQFMGQWVKIRTNDKTYKGVLTAVTDNGVQLQKGEHEFDVEFTAVKTARVVPEPTGE